VKIARGAAAALLAVAPAVFAAWYIDTYGVNGAHWDHLSNAELFDRYDRGALTLNYLFNPHLEHVKAFPRLVCLLIGLGSSFNNLAEMYFQWLLLCFTAAVLGIALRQRLGMGAGAILLLMAPVTVVLLSPRHHEALLVGDGMITYLSIAAAVTALSLLASEGAWRTALGAAAAFVASFSHANGFLLWPIGVVLIAADRPRSGPTAPTARVVRLGVWLSVAALSSVLLVLHWPATARSHLSGTVASPAHFGMYMLQAAGTVFGSSPAVQMGFGACLIAIEAWAVAMAARRWRAGGRAPFGVWLILFAVACQTLIALGRASLDAGVGVASRYAAFVGFGIIGAYLVALELDAGSTRLHIRRPLLAATLAVIVLGSVFAYREGIASGSVERDGRLRAVQVLRTVRWQNDSTIAALLYPFPGAARRYVAVLERMRLNVFAEPLPDPARLPRGVDAVPEYYIDLVNYRPPDGQPIRVSGGQALAIAGWAFDRHSRKPFRLGFARFEPAGLTLPVAYGLMRPDVARVHRLPNADTGFGAVFSTDVLREGSNTVTLQFITEDPPRSTMTRVVAVLVRQSGAPVEGR
jgi:hypothetical protein